MLVPLCAYCWGSCHKSGVAQQKAAYKDKRGTRGGEMGERKEGEQVRVREYEGNGKQGGGVAARQPVKGTESERGR